MKRPISCAELEKQNLFGAGRLMLRKLPGSLVVAHGRLNTPFLIAIPRRCMSRAYESYHESLAHLQEPPPFPSTSSTVKAQVPFEHTGEVQGDEKELVVEGDNEPLSDFAVLGVRKSVRVALYEAFPNIRTPTACQTAFIPALLSRKDVILKDWTGTGKSFGLVLALLSKTRATRPHMPYKERITLAKRPITSMVVVPHRDLAYQLMHWIRMLCPHNAEESLHSVAQVCVRGNPASPLSVQLQRLREQAPHILIGTPQALVEILEADRAALQIATLDTVVVDEVDYLLPVPSSGAPKKVKWKWDAHPPPTLKLLNALFEDRSKIRKQESSMPWRFPLQAVFSSATLRHHLRRFFFSETNWMDRYSEVVKIDFERGATQGGAGEVQHYALVVDDAGAVRNMKIDRSENGQQKDGSASSTKAALKKSAAAKSDQGTRSVKPAILEAIATTFALDVPKIALLVLPAAAPVTSVVEELHALGVNARSLGLQDEDRGKQELMRSALKKFNRGRQTRKPDADEGEAPEPSLLVSTEASIRGLDLPELSHVFLAGVPESEVEYNHAAGRVGRFGREGKVVVFLEASGECRAVKETRWAKAERLDDGERLQRLYMALGLTPSQFEHINT